MEHGSAQTRLVDAHVHVWAADAMGPEDDLGPPGTVERLLATFNEHGVERGVVIQPSVYGSDHSYFLSALAAAPSRLVGVALAEPDDPTSLETLQRIVGDAQIRGIRIPIIRAPSEWLRAVGEPLWQLARSSSCVIGAFLNPGQLSALAPLLERFPDVPVVIDHLARLDLAAHSRAEALHDLLGLARHRNITVKISALGSISRERFPYRDTWPEVGAVLEAFGVERVLWGSDYPPILLAGPYEQSVAAAKMALETLPADKMEATFYKNALRLFWDEATAVDRARENA